MIDTRVMRSADVASDHCLVRSTIRLKLKRAPVKVLVKALYDDFECALVDKQDTTKWFKIKSGVKQG